MTQFPTTTAGRYWQGENLYEYNTATLSWNKTIDLTPIHHWRLNDTSTFVNQPPITQTVGYTTKGGTADSWGAGAVHAASRLQMPMNGVIQNIVMYIKNSSGNACKARMGLYADVASSATTLLAQSSEISIANGFDNWQTFTLTPYSITAGTYFYPALYQDQTIIPYYGALASAIDPYRSLAYSSTTMPDPFGTPTAVPTGRYFSAYVNYFPASCISDSGSYPTSGFPNYCILSQTGKIDKSISFNSATGYIQAVNAGTALATTTAFSMALWFKYGGTKTQDGILCISPWTNSYGAFSLYYLNSVCSAYYPQQSISVSYSWQNDGLFHHMASTWDGSLITFYKDGALITSTACSQSKYMNCNLQDIVIGSYYGPGNNLDGSLEDVRIYNRALTQQEISAIYNRTKGTYSHSLIQGYPTVKPPVHHWRLNETTSITVSDSGSSPVPLPVGTGVLVNQAGLFDTSYSFTGTVSIMSKDQNFGTYVNGLSGSLWLKIPATQGAIVIPFQFHHPNNYTYIDVEFVYDKLAVFMYTGTTAYQNAYQSLTLNSWHHAAWSGGVGGGVSIYIDGVNVYYTSSSYSAPLTASNCWIGAQSGTTRFYNGYIQDIRIYNYPISAQEVVNLYNGGRGTHL